LVPFFLGERIVDVGAVFSFICVVSLLLSLPFLYDPSIPTTSLSSAPAAGTAAVGGFVGSVYEEPPPPPPPPKPLLLLPLLKANP